MDSSKALVKKAIEFGAPHRIPYNFDSNREGDDKARYGDDFLWVFVDAPGGVPLDDNTGDEYSNEWGVTFRRMGKTFGEAVVYPLENATSAEQLWVPDYRDAARYAGMEKAVAECPDRYILGMFPHFLFLHMLDLFGFENLMVQMLDNRDLVVAVADRLADSCIEVARQMAGRGADGIIAIEDLGLQDRLIISPALWREIFLPRYKRIVDAVHASGLHFFFHSCGHITTLIDDLIQIGTDVIQLDQQDNMGVDTLAAQFGGRICFFCPVDIQTVLTRGSLEEIEDSAKRLMKVFGDFGGGFMAKTYPRPDAIGIPAQNTAHMCHVFKKYGAYPLVF